MKISKIEFENFRNFKEHGEIRCSTDGKVTIIYGKIGDGKTTLHQLVQWIFYGKVHFNKTYFVQRFKELWGVPPMKYVSNLRCQKARYLLVNSDLSVSEVSAVTGFKSPHYFSTVFKKYTGSSPNDFRKLENQYKTS